MDGSDLRRGQPTVHRRFADQHREDRGRGEARRFGDGAAILVGDFAFVYSDMLFASAPAAARPVFDELRIELCVGQFLDLAATAVGSRDRARAELIERYKSGKYTVERPFATRRGIGRSGATSSVLRSPHSGCPSVRRSNYATTCSGSSATHPSRQAGWRRSPRGQADTTSSRLALPETP